MAITIDSHLEFTEQTQALDPFPGYSGFRHIRTFCKDENTIYLVVVADENAINVIFQFHATADMNFLSGYGLFCAYPNLTFNNKSYTNPSAADSSGNGYNLKMLAKKLKRRGLEHRTRFVEHSQWETHVCGTEKNCPTTLRSMYDEAALFVPFESVRTKSWSPTMYNGKNGVVWSLGGPPCNGRGLYTDLINMTVPVYHAEVEGHIS
ncbi:hypothetical protein R3P38DRAFT_2785894 [Favolaschia claudopus]|uniref:Uncharacterized protein n=1 Tax=Favolaschia claudopus TaxID=2862362 RepID=A0AAW0AU96_9AGAR